MDMETYERRLRNSIYVVCVIAGATIIFAVSLLVSGMWLKALVLALFGIAVFMLAFSLRSKWDGKGRWFFWLFMIFIALSLAAFGYGLYCMIF
jgi:Na+/phosphate symporter